MTTRRLVSLALSSLAAVACSAAATPDRESVGSVHEAVTKSICRSVVLAAEKDYSPVHYVDGTASVSPGMRFDIPRTIAVTAGKAGRGSVTLQLHDGSRSTTCTYRGSDECGDEWWRHGRGDGDRYRLESCSRHSGGDDATADSFVLHVADGDAQDAAQKTAVAVTLTEEGNCVHAPPPPVDAGPPPVDASPPPPVDAAPPPDAAPVPLAPCTTDAQCDDGSTCTADACTNNACTHTPVTDGAACDDGNSCTTGDACTAGACAGVTAADGTACDDSQGCTSGGACSAGKCAGASAVPDGTVCGQTDLCFYSSGAACSAGACKGTPDCGGVECVSSACVASTGACLPAPVGTPCSGGTCDGNFGCGAGTPASSLTAATPLCATQPWWECYAKTGVFSSSSNECEYAAIPAGTTCSAGVCDGSGACVASATGPGTGQPLLLGPSCPFGGPCTSAGSIDLATGACEYVNLVAGTPCGGGGHCDGSGACGP